MMQTYLTILDLIGIVAASASGALIAIQRKLDLVGVVFLGVVSALGGGVLRDLMIGHTPPRSFEIPAYLIAAIATAMLFLLSPVRRGSLRHHKQFDTLLLIMDSLGVASFTISGVQAGFEAHPDASPLLLIFLGILTATGGGILRDVLTNTMPMVFVKHVYALASLIGGFLYWLLIVLFAQPVLAAVVSLAVTFTIRCLAAYYHWNIPRAKG